jgi:hypothetical protein
MQAYLLRYVNILLIKLFLPITHGLFFVRAIHIPLIFILIINGHRSPSQGPKSSSTSAIPTGIPVDGAYTQRILFSHLTLLGTLRDIRELPPPSRQGKGRGVRDRWEAQASGG